MIILSTNYARAKYQEIYDINTVSDQVSIIGIHTPTGTKPRQMLAGFFTQFRKYKYAGCSVVATPAQRLGLNLAQISTEAGASTVNPKDVFNPALVRGCHGDNLNSALNSIYNGAFENEGSSLGLDDHSWAVAPTGTVTWEQMYYRMLQDPSFKKFNLNSGIKLSGLRPMVYNVASNHQIVPNETSANVGQIVSGTGSDGEFGFSSDTIGTLADGSGSAASVLPQFMTNRLQTLGWLDTRQVINSKTTTSSDRVVPGYTTLPRIFMSLIVLPPALSDSVVTSMRFVITHYFEFKEFNTSLTLESVTEYYDWLTTQSKGGDRKDPDDPKVLNDTFDTNGLSDSIEMVSDGCF